MFSAFGIDPEAFDKMLAFEIEQGNSEQFTPQSQHPYYSQSTPYSQSQTPFSHGQTPFANEPTTHSQTSNSNDSGYAPNSAEYTGSRVQSMLPKKYINHDENYNRVQTAPSQDDFDQQRQEFEEERDAYASIYTDDYNDPNNEINHNTNGNGLFVLSCTNINQRPAPGTAGSANLSTPQIHQRHQERYNELQSLFSMPNNLTQHDIDVLNVSIIAEEYKHNKHLQRQQHLTEDQCVEQQIIAKSMSRHVQRLARPAKAIAFNSTSPKRSTLTPRHRIHTYSIARDDDGSQFSPENSTVMSSNKPRKKADSSKTFKHSLFGPTVSVIGSPPKGGYNYGGYVPKEVADGSPVLTVESFVHVAQRMKDDIKQLVQETIRSELKAIKKPPLTPAPSQQHNVSESERIRTAATAYDSDNSSIGSNNNPKKRTQLQTHQQTQLQTQQQSLQTTIERKVSAKIAQLNEDLAMLKSGKGIPSSSERLYTAEPQIPPSRQGTSNAMSPRKTSHDSNSVDTFYSGPPPKSTANGARTVSFDASSFTPASTAATAIATSTSQQRNRLYTPSSLSRASTVDSTTVEQMMPSSRNQSPIHLPQMTSNSKPSTSTPADRDRAAMISPATLARNSTANGSSRGDAMSRSGGGPRDMLVLAEMTTSFAPTAVRPTLSSNSGNATSNPVSVPAVVPSHGAILPGGATSASPLESKSESPDSASAVPAQSNTANNSGGFSAEEVSSLESEYATLTKEMTALTKSKSKIKKELKVWVQNFEKEHGRAPTTDEKLTIEDKFQSYKNITTQVEESKKYLDRLEEILKGVRETL